MKKLKKLILKKEIVANLSESEMRGVVGGGYSGLLLTCCICTHSGGYQQPKTENAACPSKVICPSQDCTKPPRCCEYGCCETLYC